MPEFEKSEVTEEAQDFFIDLVNASKKRNGMSKDTVISILGFFVGVIKAEICDDIFQEHLFEAIFRKNMDLGTEEQKESIKSEQNKGNS